MKLTLQIDTIDDMRQAHALLASLLSGAATTPVAPLTPAEPERDEQRSETAAQIGMAIAAARATRGWSQQELAQQCGVTQTTVSQWEGGLISLKGARRARLRVLRAMNRQL